MQDEEYQAMAVDAVSADQFDRVSGPRGPAFFVPKPGRKHRQR